MTFFGFGLVIVTALLIGMACQLVGRTRNGYDWEVGTVGALYGGLLANVFATRMAPEFGVEGVLVVPTVLGGALFGGLLVFGIRTFGSPISSIQRQPLAQVAACTRQVKLQYAATLIEEPIVERMRRQFGVTARVGRTEIVYDRGWIELQLIGTPAAIDYALQFAQRSGITIQAETDESMPALAA